MKAFHYLFSKLHAVVVLFDNTSVYQDWLKDNKVLKTLPCSCYTFSGVRFFQNLKLLLVISLRGMFGTLKYRLILLSLDLWGIHQSNATKLRWVKWINKYLYRLEDLIKYHSIYQIKWPQIGLTVFKRFEDLKNIRETFFQNNQNFSQFWYLLLYSLYNTFSFSASPDLLLRLLL